MPAMNPTRRKHKHGKKNPKPRNHKAMPPGRKMRLCRYARELTREVIDGHNGQRETVVLELGSNNKPVKDNSIPANAKGDRPYHKTKRVQHLEIPGLVVLYKSDLQVDEIVLAETSMKATLDAILNAKQDGTNYTDITHYKVSKFSPPLSLVAQYFDEIWEESAKRDILMHYKGVFEARGHATKQAGKPAHAI